MDHPATMLPIERISLTLCRRGRLLLGRNQMIVNLSHQDSWIVSQLVRAYVCPHKLGE